MSDQIKAGLWKKDGDRGSYYSGRIEINGQEYWVNLYKNDRKQSENHPDLNIVLKPKENTGRKAAAKAKQEVSRVTDDFEDSSIPF